MVGLYVEYVIIHKRSAGFGCGFSGGAASEELSSTFGDFDLKL
jgi:hypothetical protein